MKKIKSMKKIIYILFAAFLVAIMFQSCELEEEQFDEALLTGKWESGTLYYRYFSDGSGYTWDEGDDVMEEEAQDFTWTLVNSELTHIHILEIGGTVPKVYTLLELTSNRLEYEDDFGKRFSFTKVSN
ncbi:MAG: hypothetical protein ACP5E3_07720 [Bacteroidales bacterium]